MENKSSVEEVQLNKHGKPRKQQMTPERLAKLAEARQKAALVKKKMAHMSHDEKVNVLEKKLRKMKNDSIIEPKDTEPEPKDTEPELKDAETASAIPAKVEDSDHEEEVSFESEKPIKKSKAKKGKKKPVVIVDASESESSESDDAQSQVIYIKKKSKNKKQQPRRVDRQPSPVEEALRYDAPHLTFNPFHGMRSGMGF